MLPRIIKQQLASLRQRERVLRFVWGTARLLTVILGLIVLACLIDYTVELFGDTPFALHITLLAFLGAGIALASVLFFWSVGKRLGDDELSLWVEDKTPALEHRLISAVQFNQEGAEVLGMSRELVGIVTLEAEQHVRKVPVAQVADHSRLKRSAQMFFPAVLLAALPLIFFPEMCGILLGRLFLSGDEIPRRVKVESATAAVHPSGENLIVKVKASGALPGDRASMVFTLNGVSDRVNMTVSHETLFVKLPLLSARTDELRTKVETARGGLSQARQKYADAKRKITDLADLAKKTDDVLKREALDLEVTVAEKEAGSALDRARQLGGELKKDLFVSQESVREEVESHKIELERFNKERPSDGVKSAIAELAVVLKDLERDNLSANAQKHLLAAQAALAGADVRLVEGDVIAVQLPIPDADFTWLAKKDDLLTPDGDAVTRGHEQGPDTWTQRFTAGKHGKANLELSYQKKSGGDEKKSLKLTFDVAAREFTYYQAEVQAAGDSLQFRAYVGDGRMKQPAELLFAPRPVADVTAYVILPGYCQTHKGGDRYQIRQSSGEAIGIKGSGVRIEAAVLNKIKWAKLHLYEVESRDPDLDDPWKKRERFLRTVPMNLFLTDEELDLTIYAFTPFFAADVDAEGNAKRLEGGADHEDVKEGAEVNFDANAVGGLIQVRLIGSGSKPLPGIDGAHRGTITKLDREAGKMKVKRSHGPTIAEGTFELDPRISSYSVEVVDSNGFKNDPIPRMAAKLYPEPAPIVALLREEMPNDVVYQRITGKKMSGRDISGIFEGMPVPVGGKIPVAYKFSGALGVGSAKLKYRILKKRLSGNESQISETLGLALDDGAGTAKIRDVLEGGPADKAELKVNDEITQVDNTKVVNAASFLKAVEQVDPGQELSVQFRRGDQDKKVKVVVGARASLSFGSITLPEYRNDGQRGDFELERGCFQKSGVKESIGFYTIPGTAPVPKMIGGGRYQLETSKLGGGNGPQEGDQVEFYIEVYPAGDPTGRPFGRSETRTKLFASAKELALRILASDHEASLIRGLQDRQGDVFPDETDPKNVQKKEKKKTP